MKIAEAKEIIKEIDEYDDNFIIRLSEVYNLSLQDTSDNYHLSIEDNSYIHWQSFIDEISKDKKGEIDKIYFEIDTEHGYYDSLSHTIQLSVIYVKAASAEIMRKRLLAKAKFTIELNEKKKQTRIESKKRREELAKQKEERDQKEFARLKKKYESI